MALTEQFDPCDRIEIIADGSLQVREATRVLRDGLADPKFPPSYHRYVLHPGDDVTGKDTRIVAVANATWTPAVIAAWQTAQQALAVS